METWKKSWQIASEQKRARQGGKEAIVRLQNRAPIKISQGNIWEEDQGQAGPDHADQELKVLVDFGCGEWNKEAGSMVLVETEEEKGELGRKLRSLYYFFPVVTGLMQPQRILGLYLFPTNITRVGEACDMLGFYVLSYFILSAFLSTHLADPRDLFFNFSIASLVKNPIVAFFHHGPDLLVQ